MKINGQITVIATYEDAIRISISDKDAGRTFIEMELTREQFINATMNRMGDTDIKSTEVMALDKVGKVQECEPFIVEIPVSGDRKTAIKLAANTCPEGWVPDLMFDTNETFYTKNGKHYARTIIRRWVERKGS